MGIQTANQIKASIHHKPSTYRCYENIDHVIVNISVVKYIAKSTINYSNNNFVVAVCVNLIFEWINIHLIDSKNIVMALDEKRLIIVIFVENNFPFSLPNELLSRRCLLLARSLLWFFSKNVPYHIIALKNVSTNNIIILHRLTILSLFYTSMFPQCFILQRRIYTSI